MLTQVNARPQAPSQVGARTPARPNKLFKGASEMAWNVEALVTINQA